jgi:hypothetical protein
LPCDEIGTGLEIARARIIAEPGPCLHDIFGRCCRQRLDIRPFLDKGAEIGLHRFDRGLLQHDFGKPDPVGIGPRATSQRARRDAPRQVAVMRIIPIKQAGRDLAAIPGCGLAGLVVQCH